MCGLWQPTGGLAVKFAAWPVSWRPTRDGPHSSDPM